RQVTNHQAATTATSTSAGRHEAPSTRTDRVTSLLLSLRARAASTGGLGVSVMTSSTTAMLLLQSLSTRRGRRAPASRSGVFVVPGKWLTWHLHTEGSGISESACIRGSPNVSGASRTRQGMPLSGTANECKKRCEAYRRAD